MEWSKHSATWPMAQHSRFVECRPHRWHVQEVGTGPLLLLIHGAGGATHSWRHLVPLLSAQYRVVMIDLPGQGFSHLGASRRCGLDAMAEDLQSLCIAENWQPAALIGHSAGAAIALRLWELSRDPPARIIGINAALEPFDGLAGVVFPLIAKTISALPLAADFFSATTARGAGVARIIKGTGSSLSAADLALYRCLVASPAHVNATLRMMAQWDLSGLMTRLPRITANTLFIIGENDGAVPPEVSRRAAVQMPHARCEVLPGLGHLAHEEDAAAVGELILAALGA